MCEKPIERYDWGYIGMSERWDGDYVSIYDYEDLETRLEEAEKTIRALTKEKHGDI